MSLITFSVIDQTCESVDRTFFPPRIAISTKSTTQIATVIGFSEYAGFVSSPPKKYRRITWSGTSEQTLFVGAAQIAGARFDYSGSTEIDLQGNVLSNYNKVISEMCTAADGKCQGIGFQSPAVLAPAVAAFNIKGWLGFAGSQSCPGTGIPYTTGPNESVQGLNQSATLDAGLPSGVVFGTGDVFFFFNSSFAPVAGNQAQDVTTGTQLIQVFFQPQVCGTLVPQGPILDTSRTNANLNWNQNYSAILDEEYTDAQALANAQVILANGNVASSSPRTTGFVSTFTSVVFTLTCTNLIAGQNYTVSVDFADTTAGTVTTKTYPITGDSTLQKVITDIIPTPMAGHSVQVRNPQIQFS